MGLPMKIRAQMKSDFADIKVLMNHPMESGLRKDAKTGELVPAHFIKTFTIRVNDKVVIEGHCSQAVARNPVFGIRLKDARAGDKVAIDWVDTVGDTSQAEAVIAPAAS
jgi:sulfur-oxidizing protein SoxZ